MIQLIQRWEIHVYFAAPEPMIILVLYDNHYSNMIRKLSEIHFLNEPTSIEIKKSVMDNQTGVTNG